jgi:hypothetical protein
VGCATIETKQISLSSDGSLVIGKISHGKPVGRYYFYTKKGVLQKIIRYRNGNPQVKYIANTPF